MTKPSITPRIYYSTYLRFRRNFKAQRGETMASYFERLSKAIEDGDAHNKLFHGVINET